MYAARNGLLWVAGGRPTPAALALLQTLQHADAYGLEPQDYDAAGLAALAAEGPGSGRALSTASAVGSDAFHTGTLDAQRWATFDINLSAAALKLVCDLHYGRIDPRAAGFDLGKPRADDLDLTRELLALATTRDTRSQLAAIEPQFFHYRLLERALPHYQLLSVSDPAAQSQVRKIELTLERWRWLPGFGTPPIIVNIPQFRLFAFRTTADRAADILQMEVIVGRTFPRTRTPVFVADMTSVIFRPYWDVPRSIMLREELPKIRARPAYFAAQHLEIVRGASDDTATPLPLDAASLQLLESGAARLRQRPGPDNALGLIKFDLPNRYNVYLHSTPAQQLFLRQRRAFSHGCIRVSDPMALASFVLRDTPGDWTPARIEAAMNGAQTRRVRLGRPIRVIILYGTVLAKEDGEVLFFDDLYRQDRRLERLLGLSPVTPNRPRRLQTEMSSLANRG
ncbi:MAG: L,D-transpeptidase family protein [Gammaproteobacteria bacterium]|nr:L,D-transpeptidase family protein [Gammaproteobacteria bacterium]